MKVNITINGKEIATNTEFRNNTMYSESGTKYILCEINGEKVTLRKHWSFRGKEWDVWSGHDFESMVRLNKSIVMTLTGEALKYVREDGTECDSSEFNCYGEYNVEFNLIND